MVLDIRPLDLEETEKFVFNRANVGLDVIDRDLMFAVTDILDDVIGGYNTAVEFSADHKANFDLLKEDVQKAIDGFNRDHIPHYFSDIFGTAKVVAKIFKLPNNKAFYNADIEFNGLTQDEVNRLPESIQITLYQKYLETTLSIRQYLHNAPEKAAIQSLEKALKKDLERFSGQLLKATTLESIRLQIRSTLSRIVDEVEINHIQPIYPNKDEFAIRAILEDRYGRKVFNLRIGFYR